jgi:hypothetical protein
VKYRLSRLRGVSPSVVAADICSGRGPPDDIQIPSPDDEIVAPKALVVEPGGMAAALSARLTFASLMICSHCVGRLKLDSSACSTASNGLKLHFIRCVQQLPGHCDCDDLLSASSLPVKIPCPAHAMR